MMNAKVSMRKLGEILLETGATTVGELHTALEACHRFRSRLGTQLVRLGFVTEKQLLEALQEQTGRPHVPREILEAASIDVMGLIPLKAAQRLHLVPFAKLHRNLHVAMINPGDDVAIEEIRTVTGLDVEPFVVTESALESALARLGAWVPDANGADGRAEKSGPDGSDWDDIWNGSLPTVKNLLDLPQRLEEHDWDSGAMYATYPGLAPVVDPSAISSPDFLDEASLQKALCAADSRDAVGDALLSYAARFLTRLCLFSVFKDQVHGWLVEGMGPVLEDVQSFVVDIKLASMFSEAAAGSQPHEGPIPSGELNESIASCLGDPVSSDVFLMPVRVQDRTIAFLLGDIPGHSTIGVPVRDLVSAATATGMALEMIILRRKVGKVLGA